MQAVNFLPWRRAVQRRRVWADCVWVTALTVALMVMLQLIIQKAVDRMGVRQADYSRDEAQHLADAASTKALTQQLQRAQELIRLRALLTAQRNSRIQDYVRALGGLPECAWLESIELMEERVALRGWARPGCPMPSYASRLVRTFSGKVPQLEIEDDAGASFPFSLVLVPGPKTPRS